MMIKNDYNPVVVMGGTTAVVLATTVSLNVGGVQDTIAACLGRMYWMIKSSPAFDGSVSDNGDPSSSSIIKLSEAYVYPVKALRAVSVETVSTDRRGLVGDRRFMLVIPRHPPLAGSFGPTDATHNFVTQRQVPTLATIQVLQEEDGSLVFSSHLLAEGKQSFKLEASVIEQAVAANNIWRARLCEDETQVLDLGDEVAAFFQQIVDKDDTKIIDKNSMIRLVAQKPNENDRPADERFVPAAARSWMGHLPQIALSNEFPVLIASQASLHELNRRLVAKGKAKLPMSRFRPNLVVTGTHLKPFEEDTWKVISIGNVKFHLVRACRRCRKSCTDQQTGQVTDEPLVTLAEFRVFGKDKDVFFAQNAIPHTIGGQIHVGDHITVLERGEPVYEAA